MTVHFVTPTRISLINLTTIGDSEKREDASKIGKFSSGMAYATALLLRDGVKMTTNISGGECDQKGKYTEYISYYTKNLICTSTKKEKEIIALDYEKQFHGVCDSESNFYEGATESEYIETAFALQLGYNWEIWMAYRELMSNVIDEGGYVLEQDFFDDAGFYGTFITLEFDESNEFFNIWKDRELYMNSQDPLFKLNSSVEVLKNDDGYLRIYKQNILVYEDKKRPSLFAWNIKFGEIDERRVLNNIYFVEQRIATAILNTSNEEFLRQIITPDFKITDGEFLSDAASLYESLGETAKKIVYEVYDEHLEVNSYYWIIDKVKNQKDCRLAGKKIKSIEDSIWSYSGIVTIETAPKLEKLTFADEVKQIFNFDLDVEVRRAKLKGSVAVADTYENCIIVDENFNISEDFHKFVVEYLYLTQEGNVVDSLSNFICNLLRK